MAELYEIAFALDAHRRAIADAAAGTSLLSADSTTDAINQEHADRALESMHASPFGREARLIGEVRADHPGPCRS